MQFGFEFTQKQEQGSGGNNSPRRNSIVIVAPYNRPRKQALEYMAPASGDCPKVSKRRSLSRSSDKIVIFGASTPLTSVQGQHTCMMSFQQQLTMDCSPRSRGVENLKNFWSELVFDRVYILNADPNQRMRLNNGDDQECEKMWPLYNGYSGVTQHGICFDREDYKEIDLVNKVTFGFEETASCSSKSILPVVGQMICGKVASEDSGAKHFVQWFRCSPQFELLWRLIVHGRDHEDFKSMTLGDLVLRLTTAGPAFTSDIPYEYVAISYQHIYCIIAYCVYFGYSTEKRVDIPPFTNFPTYNVYRNPLDRYVSMLQQALSSISSENRRMV